MSDTFTETIIAEPIGMTLEWADSKIVRLHVAWADRLVESGELTRMGVLLKEALERYVNGHSPMWPALPLDDTGLTEFQRNVLDALQEVTQGDITTYGELADQVGSPHGAQAIGKTMALNPFPIIYPCHRVIGKSGDLTGFSGGGGVKLKEYLLKLEGAWEKVPNKKDENKNSQPSLLDLLD